MNVSPGSTIPVDTRAHDPLSRREAGGQLRGFRRDYLDKKTTLLKPVMQAVRAAGRFDDAILLDPSLAEIDERAAEYPIALAALMEAAANPELQILDVGCVFNNEIIRDHAAELARMIWFMNPSLEPLAYKSNVAYILADARTAALPGNLGFGLVTCLSTIEHTGMDNTRYGGAPAEFQGEIADPEKFAVESLRSIQRWVAPGGRLLVSVPFGPFEYVYVYGEPEKPIFYSFDAPRLARLAAALSGFLVKTYMYKVVPGRGWVRAELTDEDVLPYAHRCAGAGGVAFIDALRIDG